MALRLIISCNEIPRTTAVKHFIELMIRLPVAIEAGKINPSNCYLFH